MFRLAYFVVFINVVISDPRPCEVLFNATFDKDLNDDRMTSVEFSPRSDVHIRNPEGAVGGGAADLSGALAKLWVFDNNELGDTFQIRFRFQSSQKNGNFVKFLPLVNNGCLNDKPSIVIEYRAISRSYRFMVRDEIKFEIRNCTYATETPWEFQQVSLEYHSGNFTLRTGGEICAQADGFTGSPALTECPLFIGGISENRPDENFWGYIDELFIQRGCVDEV